MQACVATLFFLCLRVVCPEWRQGLPCLLNNAAVAWMPSRLFYYFYFIVFIIIIYLGPLAVHLFRDIMKVLMHHVPDEVDVSTLRADLLKIPGVIGTPLGLGLSRTAQRYW